MFTYHIFTLTFVIINCKIIDVVKNYWNEVIEMEELRTKLEELILTNGTADNEVLKVSQLLDNHIINYYKNKLNFDYRQAL